MCACVCMCVHVCACVYMCVHVCVCAWVTAPAANLQPRGHDSYDIPTLPLSRHLWEDFRLLCGPGTGAPDAHSCIGTSDNVLLLLLPPVLLSALALAFLDGLQNKPPVSKSLAQALSRRLIQSQRWAEIGLGGLPQTENVLDGELNSPRNRVSRNKNAAM